MGAKDGKRLAPKIIFQPLQPVLHSQGAYLCFSPCVLRLETTGTTGKNNLDRGARANTPASYRVPRRNAPVARCTCREAIRFLDEQSEELSRSESRKSVRGRVG